MLRACEACRGQGFVELPRCNCREASCDHEPMFGHPEDETEGLYQKFWVSRTDGSSLPGEKHEKCRYFVLDLVHDEHAPAALRAYAGSCAEEYPELAADLLLEADRMERDDGRS